MGLLLLLRALLALPRKLQPRVCRGCYSRDATVLTMTQYGSFGYRFAQ
jgi:hypothetical protein